MSQPFLPSVSANLHIHLVSRQDEVLTDRPKRESGSASWIAKALDPEPGAASRLMAVLRPVVCPGQGPHEGAWCAAGCGTSCLREIVLEA